MLSLTELLTAYEGHITLDPKWERLVIKSIASDSRHVTPGTLFVALKGAASDGVQYVHEAKKKGAVAILVEDGAAVPEDTGLCVVRVDNVRKCLAKIAAKYYAPQPECVVAVTGTDGKTSTADFYRQFMAHLEKKSAAIGTLGVTGIDDPHKYPAINTTPDSVQLHKTLFDLAADGYTHIAMEASSHGLDQFRLDGVRLKAAAFTNLTRDHLDYHGTVDAYFAAKARLFAELLPKGATAVLNADDARYGELNYTAKSRGCSALSFGRKGEDFKLVNIKPTLHGQEVEVSLSGTPYKFSVPLVGEFQVMNILAALALVQASGADMMRALLYVSDLHGVNGRLEKVAQHPQGAPIFIDYAHTPAALANLLKTLRPHVENKLAVVFGCGGDRDKGKRPQMGKSANDLADKIYVTDDNPRTEDAQTIRAEVMAGAKNAKEISGRKEAITHAIMELERGDVLVIAGKGHEKMQIIGTSSYPFDDAAVARQAVGLLHVGEGA